MSLVGVIECATKHVSFLVYLLPDKVPIAMHKVSLTFITPKAGWYEQDPRQIITLIQLTMSKALEKLKTLGFEPNDIASVGITNQRETIVAWDGRTSKPLYNAIMWKDMRTAAMVNLMADKSSRITAVTGLQLSTMFPALKIRWMVENVARVKEAADGNYLKVGTIDSWVAWIMTNGSLHVTDATNASRTLLMNIDTLLWDDELLGFFAIKSDWLPVIRSSSEIYGNITSERLQLRGTRISAIIGNQQAALVGEHCLQPGMAKNSYRSGCFLLCNVGTQAVRSKHGLLTTVAYKLGPNAPAHYALEGSIMVGGHLFSWLEKRLGLLDNLSSAVSLAESVPNSGDVYFVPAFRGMAAPHWRQSARGILVGLSQSTHKTHIMRAGFDAICFQTRDIIETMRKDTGFPMAYLVADGPLVKYDLLMQIQANLLGFKVYRSDLESGAPLGAAMCAAQAVGIGLYNFANVPKDPYKSWELFLPKLSDKERDEIYAKWQRAVVRSFDWILNSELSAKTPANPLPIDPAPVPESEPLGCCCLS